MSDFLDIPSPEIFFVADTHFRSRGVDGESERRDRFIRFVDGVPTGSTLFLLGDIFDFYFEYRSVVSKNYLDIFSALSRCQTRNVSVHFVGGNHDYWVGGFVTDDLGVRVHEEEIAISAQGRRIVCAHGDLVMPRDWGYKILKTIIRNRAVIAVSRWIHPDIMDHIANGVSTGSRKLGGPTQEKRARVVAEHAHAHFFRRGNDAFIMGHVHYPLHERQDGHDFMVVGDWYTSFTYGKLTEGRLTLEAFTG